jgi:teichoic acid transport system ATP-binding protein
MLNNLAIRFDRVYFSYATFVRTSIREYLLKKLTRKPIVRSRGQIQALKNISFEVQKGKNIGIVGSNGSGKSTMLRLIAGVYWPDEGEVEIESPNISLMSLGSGFQEELSGIDNIYISGLLHGLSKKQIDARLGGIISFSGLDDYVNNPIKTYSSGMVSRLAFSISSSIEPDILLIDEILGVGDENFKEKSSSRIRQLVQEDHRTVLLVSHNLQSIVELCDEAIWLEKGEIIQIGNPQDVVDAYKQYIKNKVIGNGSIKK